MSVLTAALEGLSLGVFPTPIRPGEKRAYLDGWPDLRLEAEQLTEYFSDDGNTDSLGWLLGIVPAFIADVDCDCGEAIVAASLIAGPTTERVFGPATNPRSHYLFSLPAEFAGEKFADSVIQAQKPMLVELRGKRQQSVVPPSAYGDGRVRAWYRKGAFGKTTFGELRAWVAKIAAAALLARHWPGGFEARLALAGALARAGWTEEKVSEFCRAVIAIAQPGNRDALRDMKAAARRAFDRIARAEELAGLPKLREEFGENGPLIVKTVATWLSLAPTLVLNPNDPLPSARAFVTARYTAGEAMLLRHQAETFYAWCREAGVYVEQPDDHIRTELYQFLEPARVKVIAGKGDNQKEVFLPFQPTRHKVANVLDALRATINLPSCFAAPCWLSGGNGFDASDILPCRNGLLYVPTRELLTAAPSFFALAGADVDFDANAPEPANWLRFLQELWPDDQQSIDLLSELLGYLLVPDTKLQKIGMLVGPPRAAKGTIAKVLKRLVGERNCCSPTLDNLGAEFGREHLIGKSVAVIADARIGTKTDAAAVCERLLSISGEDHQSVPRKFKGDWQGQLRVRFLVLTNSLPKLEDESGAFSSRFVILSLKKSFLGREDPRLLDRFAGEYPGILNLALEGRKRLWDRGGRFTQPAASEHLVEQFAKLNSPITAFLEDCCEIGAGYVEPCSALYDAWRDWCWVNGRKNVGTAQTFARDLHAVMPELKTTQPREGDKRFRQWEGLRVRVEKI